MSEHPASAANDANEPPEAALPGGLGAMLGALDLGSLLGAASEMLAAEQAGADAEVTGSAGGGAVQIRVTGLGEFLSVRVAPELVDPQDVSLLEDTLLAALRDAMDQVQQRQRGSLGGLQGLAGLGGLDALTGMAELFGSGASSGPSAPDEIDRDRTS